MTIEERAKEYAEAYEEGAIKYAVERAYERGAHDQKAIDEKWISVSDKIPEEDKSVLVRDGKIVCIGWIHKGYWYCNYMPNTNISHWKELPKL